MVTDSSKSSPFSTKPALGPTWAHVPNTRLFIQKNPRSQTGESEVERIATLVKSSRQVGHVLHNVIIFPPLPSRSINSYICYKFIYVLVRFNNTLVVRGVSVGHKGYCCICICKSIVRNNLSSLDLIHMDPTGEIFPSKKFGCIHMRIAFSSFRRFMPFMLKQAFDLLQKLQVSCAFYIDHCGLYSHKPGSHN